MPEPLTRRRHEPTPKSSRRSSPRVPDARYAGAFARVRLVRAWIAAAAAAVALGSAFAALLDRLLP